MTPEASSNLKQFIDASKSKGASDESLAALLIRQGWPEDDVYGALGDYWAAETGVPVPIRGRTKESSREAFLYLLAFSTLCAWATAIGSAMFTYINYWFPDAVQSYSYYSFSSRSVTSEMATMVVTFPIFLLVMRSIVKESLANPEQLQSGVRKWLTYIALLGTAGAMIGDLIWFLNYLLQGEITTRFFLKSSVVMLICGAIFLYYLRFLRPPEKRIFTDDRTWNRTFAFGSIATVLTVFILGFVIAGTPAEHRDRQADTNRIQALKEIANALRVRYRNPVQENDTHIPETLQQLVDAKQLLPAQIQDRVTQTPYEYRVLKGTQYEVCASFSTSNTEDMDDLRESAFWRHPAGVSCFKLDASQDVPF